MSITLAAEDLCLTQSAVSRQIRAIEEVVGVKLLNRGYRSISFTAEGRQLFRVAESAIEQLQSAINAFAVSPERQPVTISASIGVTALWILPRLGKFQQQHANVDLRVAANNKLVDIKAEGADLAIRCCRSTNAPSGAYRLFEETVIPVAHSSLDVAHLDARAVSNNVLIELDDLRMPWLRWDEHLAKLGLASSKPKGILRFNQYDQVILAAMAGQGIALGRVPLIEPLLFDRRLVPLIESPIQNADAYSYWLVQADTSPRDDVENVVRWIKHEAKRVTARLKTHFHTLFDLREHRIRQQSLGKMQ